jgi:peptidoglycan/xylan/chitin deacetylase (PgdA/CDA1 family)
MNKIFYKSTKYFKLFTIERLKKITGHNFISPFYHTVSNYQIPHIKHLYSIRNEKEFERDLDFYLKYFNPITLSEFFTSIKEGNIIKKNSFLLSFDDGLREFEEIVAPILIRKGISATCFLNSNFIDNKNLFYRFKASLIYEKLITEDISVFFKTKLNNWFKDNKLPIKDNWKSIFSINYQNKYLLDELATILEIDFQDYLLKKQPYLSSNQIKGLIGKGFTFGAHSIDHPKYLDLDETEQINQTAKSIDEINKKFNIDYKLFSFPFTDYGIKKSFFNKVFDLKNPIADVTFGTAGLKIDVVSKNIQRIPIEIDNCTAEEIIIGEYEYYLAKNLFGKNKITRQ